jgi:nucleoside-diphosphate-sugar epimerase
MRIFVTGATGYIGTAVLEKLQQAGHQPVGLARSDASAAKLAQRGVEIKRGDLRDGRSIASGVHDCEAAIHLAIDFSRDTAQLDRAAITALSAKKPFLYTSGVWVLGNTGDQGADENTPVHPPPLVAWRPDHEELALQSGGIVIRAARVHGRGGGAGRIFRQSAIAEGAVRIAGGGENRWPFVDVDDLADLYVLALNAPAGSLYHASAGASVRVIDLARAAAKGAPVVQEPVDQARQRIGPMADALILDQVIRSTKAQHELGWRPSRPTVLEDLEEA